MVVVSIMEITPIVPLVLVVRPQSLMARIIEHDALVRKCVRAVRTGFAYAPLSNFTTSSGLRGRSRTRTPTAS